MRRTALRFDQLNSLSRSEYEEHFSVMKISDDAKEDRVLMAMAFEDRILEIFAFVLFRKMQNEMFFTDTLDKLQEAFMAVALTREGLTEEDLLVMAVAFANSVAMSTYDHQDDPFYLSPERAFDVAATQSNSVNCLGERKDAENLGRTKKTWHTIIDGHERQWHEEMDGVTIPIDEPFEVNGELMMQPLDSSLGAGADNIANCRCSLTFS